MNLQLPTTQSSGVSAAWVHADVGMLEEGMGLCCAGCVFSFRASSLFESKCSEQLSWIIPCKHAD